MNRSYTPIGCWSPLENGPGDKNAMDIFRDKPEEAAGAILRRVGEKEATDELTKNFNEMLQDPGDLSNYTDIRRVYQ